MHSEIFQLKIESIFNSVFDATMFHASRSVSSFRKNKRLIERNGMEGFIFLRRYSCCSKSEWNCVEEMNLISDVPVSLVCGELYLDCNHQPGQCGMNRIYCEITDQPGLAENRWAVVAVVVGNIPVDCN